MENLVKIISYEYIGYGGITKEGKHIIDYKFKIQACSDADVRKYIYQLEQNY